MKRLRFACPFGGKNYPIIAAFGLMYLVTIAGLIKGWSYTVIILLLILVPAAVLTVCFMYEQKLTDGERQIIAESEMPFWEMAPDELQEAVRYYQNPVNRKLLVCGGLTFLLLLTVFHNYFGVLFVVTSIMGLIIFVDHSLRKTWQEIDDTALCITVPIHHMYDITRHGKNGYEWTESYIVFYLPDGRYTLKAKKGSGYASSVTIVQFRGLFIWLPYYD